MKQELKLFSINDFVKLHSWLTKRALENQIFMAKHNGLLKAGAIIKIGRKVLIDLDRYNQWVENKRVSA